MTRPLSGPSSGAGPAGRRVTVLDGLVLLAWLLLGQVMLYGLALSVGAVPQDGEAGPGVQVGIMAAILGGTLAWLGSRGHLGGTWAPVRPPRGRDGVLGLGAGIAGFAVLVAGLGLLLNQLGFDEPQQQALEDVVGSADRALLAVVLALVLAPPLEELVFRGALHQGLRQRTGFWPAALLSSGVFAAVHLEVVTSSAAFLLPLFLLGVLFAWLLERTGNLLAPVLAHLAFNAVSLGLTALASRSAEAAVLGLVAGAPAGA